MLLVAFSCFSCCWLLGFLLRFLPVIIISSACTPGLTEEDYAASAERCHTHKLANVLLSNQTGPCREMGATQRAAAKVHPLQVDASISFPPLRFTRVALHHSQFKLILIGAAPRSVIYLKQAILAHLSL